MRMRATASHRASHADPVRVKAGEPLRPTGREEVWDGFRWLWAVGPDGREGWVPEDLPVPCGTGWVAARDYSAVELDIAAGEPVQVLEARSGWVWARRQDSAEGWLPARALRAEAG